MGTVKKSAAEWGEQVREWRASGQAEGAFAMGRGYSKSALSSWARRETNSGTAKFVRVVSPSMRQPSSQELIVEVGGARVRVRAGFDAALLGSVVIVLQERYFTDVLRVMPCWPWERYLELAPQYCGQNRLQLDAIELAAPLGPIAIPARPTR